MSGNAERVFTAAQKKAVLELCQTDTSTHAFDASDEVKQVVRNTLTRADVIDLIRANPAWAVGHQRLCNTDVVRGYPELQCAYTVQETVERCCQLMAIGDKCVTKKLKNRMYTVASRVKKDDQTQQAESALKEDAKRNGLAKEVNAAIEWNQVQLAHFAYTQRRKGLGNGPPKSIVYTTAAGGGCDVVKIEATGLKTTTRIPAKYKVVGFDDHIIVTHFETGSEATTTTGEAIFSCGYRGKPGTMLLTHSRRMAEQVVVGGGFGYFMSRETGVDSSHILPYCQGERGRRRSTMGMRRALGTLLLAHDNNTLVVVCDRGIVLWPLCRHEEYRRVTLVVFDASVGVPGRKTLKVYNQLSHAKAITLEDPLTWINTSSPISPVPAVMNAFQDAVVFQLGFPAIGSCIYSVKVPFIGLGGVTAEDLAQEKVRLLEADENELLLAAATRVLCTTAGVYTDVDGTFTNVLSCGPAEWTACSAHNDAWLLVDVLDRQQPLWIDISNPESVVLSPTGPNSFAAPHAHKRHKQGL